MSRAGSVRAGESGFRSFPRPIRVSPMRHASLARRAFVAVILAAAATAGPARAQTFNWDPAQTGTANGGGAGNWDTTSPFWFNGTSDVRWPGAGNVAVFGGAAGGAVTITTAGGVSADGLTFNTTGYSVGGDVLTLTGTAPTVTVGAGLTATVNSVVAGS